jgi:hypothetical protein
MNSTSLRAVSPSRFAWLLWLVLLLPAAQVLATAHALSHVAPIAGIGDGQQAPQDASCALCLSAAAVSGGALTGSPPPLPQVELRGEAPPVLPDVRWPAPTAPVYRSRAPPLFAR